MLFTHLPAWLTSSDGHFFLGRHSSPSTALALPPYLVRPHPFHCRLDLLTGVDLPRGELLRLDGVVRSLALLRRD